ncbi:hypothetical protein ACU81Q_14855 [Komagataeibacter melomenusus]
MTLYFAKQADGSYGFSDTRITPNATGVEVSEAQRDLLFLAQSRGAAIVASATGEPQAVSENGAGSVIDLTTVTASSNFAAPVPLKTQAQNALTAAAATTWQAYGMFGETTPADVVTYLTALRAIANGTDTTSATLPAVPADLSGTATTT